MLPFWVQVFLLMFYGQQSLRIAAPFLLRFSLCKDVSWALSVRDLRTQSTRTASLELTWYNQCLAVSLGYERNLARESDTGQDNTIMLRLNFAHLGSDMRDYRRKLREEWLGR
jgi:hypothetical protein